MDNISHEKLRSAIFAGGCFWCVEADLGKRPEIKDVESGYIGGSTKNPDYETASANGHREAVRVWYDPKETSYRELLAHFFVTHNPTDAGGSFYDRGHAYTSAIYCHDEKEQEEAATAIEDLENADVYDQKIVTEILPATDFWVAEAEHQNYSAKNPERYQQYREESGREEFIADHKEAVYEALGV